MTNTENTSKVRAATRRRIEDTAADIAHEGKGMASAAAYANWETTLLGSLTIIELAATLQEQAVDMARANGASWAHIGQMLGTSRQNAQQRFGR